MLRAKRSAGRRGLAAAALAAWAGLSGCSLEPEPGVLVLRPGAVIATYPDPASERALATGGLSALAVDGDELYVADQLAGHVLRFAEDRGFVNVLGRKGEGPGELQRPSEVEVGPDGDVWVADPPSGRVTRFEPGGDLVSTRRAPFGGGDFGLVSRGRMVVPSPTEGQLLAVVDAGDGITELAPGPEMPGALASLSPEERLGFMATFLESDPGAGAAYFLVNADDFGLWRLPVPEAGRTIGGARPIPIPGWLDEAMAAERRAQEEGLRKARLQFIPFNDMDLTPSGLWLTTGPVAAAGVSLPTAPGGRVTLVRPGPGDRGGDGRLRGLLHATLRNGRLYAVFATRVRVFALDTVGVRRRPELP